jgi:quercetin dioxygenase-like cupin family protein
VVRLNVVPDGNQRESIREESEMTGQQHEPTQSPAASEKTRIIAQTPGLRVVEYVLHPGDMLPWHHHSNVPARFYCLEGLTSVEFRAPPRQTLLRPGESCVVSQGVVHRSGNAAAGVCRYLLVQGVGTYDFATAD